ncbi:MAG: GNAT family N-acetyltransferase [Anaerolineae bacterium]|nr:GNAT family N-acetyltransferase [Anaerolineae bacterium]
MTDPCEFLEWDSDFFGHRIARVVGHRLDQRRVEAILEWCRARSIECLYFLADSDDRETVELAEDHGFRLVDVRVVLECRLDGRHTPQRQGSDSVRVRSVCPDDIPVLQSIARTSYLGSRFYFDPHFSVASCEALYETWIVRSCEGSADVVLVAEADGQPVGYVSCYLSGDGQIGLVGVADWVRRRGVGRALVDGALRWFAERGVDTVSVATQGRNVAAQRLYQGCGFSTRSLQLWYHKWMSEYALRESA